MQYLQILNLIVLCLKLTLSNRLYSDYIDQTPQENMQIQPMPYTMNPRFVPHQPKTPRKPEPDMISVTEILCEKNVRKKMEQEALENPKKERKPSGNRWHGAMFYDGKEHKMPKNRDEKDGDIGPKTRKKGKCYIWIRPKDITLYERPAVIQGNLDEDESVKEEDKKNILIEICCPKFSAVVIKGNTLCRPICHSCPNGICTDPDVCKCHDGFVLTDSLDCVFTCPISCLNGRCNLLSRGCLCNPGYELNKTGEFCRPICRNGCGMNRLHNCTAPNTCGCVRDYALTNYDCQRVLMGGY